MVSNQDDTLDVVRILAPLTMVGGPATIFREKGEAFCCKCKAYDPELY